MIVIYGINRGAYPDRIMTVSNSMRILMALREHPEIDRQTVLFHYIGNTHSNGESLVRSLAEVGLVSKVKKGRCITLILTEEGHKVADAGLKLYRLLKAHDMMLKIHKEGKGYGKKDRS